MGPVVLEGVVIVELGVESETVIGFSTVNDTVGGIIVGVWGCGCELVVITVGVGCISKGGILGIGCWINDDILGAGVNTSGFSQPSM